MCDTVQDVAPSRHGTPNRQSPGFALTCSRQQLFDDIVILFNATLLSSAASRTNLGVREDKQPYPRSVCIGAITSYGTRVAAATYRHDQFLVPVHSLALLRRVANRHSYLPIQLNQMHIHEELSLHTDKMLV